MTEQLPALRPLALDDRRALRARCIEVTQRARSTWDMAGLKVFLRFDLRGRAAGEAQLFRRKGEGILRLNVEAFHLAPAEMLEDTIPHEVAHLVAGWTRLGRGHDAGWRRIAVELGSSGKRCHTLNLTPARRTLQHTYRATCGTEVVLGPQRHARIQRGSSYRVNATGGKIEAAGYLGSQYST